MQAKLAETNASQPKTELRGEKAKLEGLIFDDRDNPMVSVHTKRGLKRYRYYVSRASLTGKGEVGSLNRISAGMLEQFLADRLEPLLSTGWQSKGTGLDRLAPALQRVTLSDDQIVAQMERAAVSLEASHGAAIEDLGGGLCSVRIPFHMRRRQGALILESAEGAVAPAAKVDRPLVRAMVLARTWAAQLERGEIDSVKALARQNGLCHNYTARLLPLAYLAPDLAESILKGTQPRAMSLAALTAAALPNCWAEQRARFAAIGA